MARVRTLALLLALAATAGAQGLERAQVQAEAAPRAALPGLPALALPQELAALPAAALAPEPARGLLGSLADRLKDAARRSPAAPILDSFWSGAASPALSEEGASETVSERLDRIVSVAQTSPTGRLVLRKAAKLPGAPRPVAFARLGKELGRYDYVSNSLLLDRRFLSGDLRLPAATLIHELTHILQHAAGIPAEALEMELEAHAQDLKVLGELGVLERVRDGFSREALRRLKRGPDAFVAWMRQQLPGKLFLEDGNFSELADGQEDELERQEDAIARMKDPRRLERARKLADWTKRDIKLLRSTAGRARYARFSRRIKTFLTRVSSEL